MVKTRRTCHPARGRKTANFLEGGIPRSPVPTGPGPPGRCRLSRGIMGLLCMHKRALEHALDRGKRAGLGQGIGTGLVAIERRSGKL
jgi:hypothetical protein